MRARRALSVIEIVISVAVIAIVAVLIVRLFAASDRWNRHARQLDEAVFASVQVFESIGVADLRGYDALRTKTPETDLSYFIYRPGVRDLFADAEVTSSVSTARAVVGREDTRMIFTIEDAGTHLTLSLVFERRERGALAAGGSGYLPYYDIRTERYRR